MPARLTRANNWDPETRQWWNAMGYPYNDPHAKHHTLNQRQSPRT